VHSHIKLGRIAGIEIGLHFSWFIVAVLIALSLAAHFRSVNPGWTPAVIWAASGITAVLFFVALLLHELAHSMVAKSRGLRVRAITLFALGGVSQIEQDAADAKSEFWIAIVGPATSAAIGFILLGLARAAGWQSGTEAHSPTMAILLWLGYINIALAVFNMIPGYPLDGGRVLRAILWWISHSQERATRWASRVGQGVAFLFIMFGLYRFFAGAGFGGLWIAFIGWFLLDAARASYLQVGIMAGLRGRTVADLMERNCPSVPGYLSVRDFVDEYLLHSPSRCFLVVSDDHVSGVITPGETRKVPRDEWEQTSVQSVMERLDQLQTVPPETPALQALQRMAHGNISHLAVMSQGALQGIFSQSQVLRFLNVFSETGAEPRHRTAA
jgi:Zn-dependent protease/CBS domain-containing protein